MPPPLAESRECNPRTRGSWQVCLVLGSKVLRTFGVWAFKLLGSGISGEDVDESGTKSMLLHPSIYRSGPVFRSVASSLLAGSRV